MEISKLNKILRKKAVEHGLCEEWQKRWSRDLSYRELLGLFIEGFDFSLKEDWLDYDFCKEAFPEEELHAMNIFINEKVNIDADKSGYYTFLGNCEGLLTVNGFLAVTVYVRHNSNIRVVATDGARVIVRVYDDAKAHCYNDDGSTNKMLDRTNKSKK